jgi:hypothetical protein
MARSILASLFVVLVVAACRPSAPGKHVEDCPAPPAKGTVGDALAPDRLPRCAKEDGRCGPVPFKEDCLEHTDYHTGAAREEVSKLPGAAQTCTFDGECQKFGGCDFACISTRNPEPTIDCSELGHEEAQLADTFCGCVEGSCAWFKLSSPAGL